MTLIWMDVSLDKSNSSLQLTMVESPHYLNVTIPNVVHLANNTPSTSQYHNPRIDDILESHSAKRRKAKDHIATSMPDKQLVATLTPTYTKCPS